MMASLLLAIGGGNAVAQTEEPVLKLQNVLNEAYNVVDLNNFVVKAGKYSLTVVGTIGQEITVRGDYGSKYVYFKYTPTSSTNVRFFRNNGKVYVYEGEDFKQEIEEHVATANPIMADGNVVDNDAQMLKDASFENHGAKYENNKYYLGSDWTTNVDYKSTNIRVTEDQNSVKDGKSKLLWRGTKCDRYFSQQISGLKPNTYYSIQLSQLDCANENADFNIGFGTSAGDLSICATTVRLGKNTAKGKFVRLVKTPETIPSGDIYFTFSCTKDNTSSRPAETDVLTHLDWVSVTEDKSSNEFLGISGVTAANYVENVVDEPNMAVVNAYKEKFKDCNKENPSDDVLINGSCDVANSGWVLSNMGYQKNTERPTRYVEKWVSTDKDGRLSGKYSASQTVYDIPAGVYVLSGTLQAIRQGQSLAITGASLNLNDKSVSVSGEWKDYSVTYVLKRDGDLTASYVINNSNANWAAMDGLSLKYTQSYLDYLKEQYAVVKATATETLNNTGYAAVTGQEKTELANAINQNAEETTNALEAAINNLESAIFAFKSAKTAYENYAEEVPVAKKFGITVDDTAPATAAAATEALKTLNVAEYNAATNDYTTAIKLGEWTTTGAAEFSNEHWSGTERNYLNQDDSNNKGWNSDKWSMTCEQTLTLPAGEYVFKAAGRKSADAVMKLSVKNGETLVGEVSNFPNGNVGLGITTDGKASFDSNDKFANANKGRGWQWRFVPFTLNAETAITFEIEAGANAIHNWASFGDYTVMAKPSVAASLTAYNQAVDEAEAALAVEANKVVTGDELTKLNAALNVDKGTTVETIDIATKTIQECTTAFTDAQPKYQALVDAKTLEQEELAYAAKDLYTAFTTFKAVTATTAADAETTANAIISTRRAYVESNGKAEGVKGAVDCTDKLQVTVAGEKMPDVSSDNLGINAGEGATDSEGNKTNKYYDTNGAFWGSDNLKAQMTQNVSGLKSGKYLLTVAARGDASLNNLTLTAGSKSINLPVQTPKNVFGNNWDDYSIETIVDNSGNLNIKIEGKTTKSHAWFSFNNFRLVRLSEAVTLDEAADNAIEAKEAADVTLKRTFVANKWNTLVLPFAVSAEDVKAKFGDDAKVVEYSNAEDVNINFTTSTNGIKANVPVLIKLASVNAKNTYTFNSVSIVVADPKAEGTTYSFVGSYKSYNLVNDDYMLYGDKWWKTEAGDAYKIKAFRAYIKANTPAAAKQLNLVIDGQTTGLKLNTVNGNIEGETYNIAGQRVANSYKGLIIKNGKKIIKK